MNKFALRGLFAFGFLMALALDASAAPAVALMGAYAGVSAGMAIGASTLMGGLMIAGGVMSGLGALTGDKTLTKLGAIAGLAGGVGQFVKAGGFEAMGNAWKAGEGVSGGLSNMADQFTGNAEFRPGMDDGTGMKGWDATVNNLNAPSTGSQIVDAPSSYFNPATGMDVQIPGNPTPTIAPSSSATGNAAAVANPAAAAAKAAGGAAKDTGLLGLWNASGDFTKYGIINAVSGGLKGMGEASATQDKMEAEKPFMDARTKNTEAQTEAINKKNAGTQAVSVGEFGTTKESAFGQNSDGSARSYAQHIIDRTDAVKRAFGAPQTAVA